MNYCLSCKPLPTNEDLGADPYDYQSNFLILEISKRLDTIKAQATENEKYTELAHQMFEISKDFMNKIVNLNFGSSYSNLILLGGIQINMPGQQNGRLSCWCVMFEILTWLIWSSID